MLTLHGFAYSNYFNIVKHQLLVKGVPYQENRIYPGEPGLLEVSPAGKVPALTTEDGVHISESSVMVDYIEEAYPQHSLYPESAQDRAKVRQIMKISELYLDLPARRLLPAAFGAGPADEVTKTEVRASLQRGLDALSQLAQFAPYVAGAKLTLADIYLRYALVIPAMVAPSQLDWDITAAVPGLAQWLTLMSESEISQKMDADTLANRDEFMARIAARNG